MKRPGLLGKLLGGAPAQPIEEPFREQYADGDGERLPSPFPRGHRPPGWDKTNARYDLRQYDALRVELLTLEKRLKHAQERIPQLEREIALRQARLIARGLLDKNGKRKPL